jgi:polyhydroxybutyrate depolymerase
MRTLTLLPVLFSCIPSRLDEHTVERTIKVGELERTFLLHVPPNLDKNAAAAVILAFHGGGTTGGDMEEACGLSALSDREGFIVVYPDGYKRNFNDGRGAGKLAAHRENVDDVAFVSAILDLLAREHKIDERRIFATGISNGAIFSHTLAAKLSKRICAIAPVVGGMADKVAADFRPERPVHVMVVQGADDPLVPYEGGPIRGLAGRDAGDHGRIVSTDEALAKWRTNNKCAERPETADLEDRDPKDGCRPRRTTWKGEAEVTLVRIEGGGHTWPGGKQYLGVRLIGPVCRDFDSTLIWQFFNSHPR